MTGLELATQLRDFLQSHGSIDAKVLEPAELATNHGLQVKASAAVECKDRSVLDFYRFDQVFENLSQGDHDCYGLPYNDHLIVCFDS